MAGSGSRGSTTRTCTSSARKRTGTCSVRRTSIANARSSSTRALSDVVVREARPEELDEAGRITLEAYRQYEQNFPAAYWEPYSVELANARGRAEAGPVVVALIDD